MKKTDKQIAKIIKDNWHTKTFKEIASLINQKGITEHAVRWRGKAMGMPPKPRGGNHGVSTNEKLTPQELLELDQKRVFSKTLQRSEQGKYRLALKKIEEMKKEMEVMYATKGNFYADVYKYVPLSRDTESIAVVLASDWHVEETVKSQWTNGLNSYSTKIAEDCARKFFVNTLKLVEKENTSTKIDTLVLALLGDFITNYLHEENVETCSLAPSEAVLFAQNLLSVGIEYLLQNSKLKLIIPCNVGNHSRTTDKVHFSTEAGNSYESIIYQNLAWRFKDNKRVTFMISESYVKYLDLGGYTIAFHHGHGIKYGGAIGGITTPVVKWIEKTERGRKADLYCFGHHHTQFDGGRFIANGSMIGYGARSLALGYGFEPRSQTFFLINLKYKRKTVVCPILFNV